MYVHMYPIDRKCQICGKGPGIWCTLPDGTSMKELHATRARPISESAEREAARYRRGGTRGAKSAARRGKQR